MTPGAKLTYALLVGAFLLACLSGYLLFTQARSLTMARDQLDQTSRDRDKAQSDLGRIRRQVEDIRSRMNLARAGTIHLVDSMEASQDFLADQSNRVKSLCAQTSGGERTADFISFCRAFSEGADLRWAANAVATRRATSVSPAEYGAGAAEYERLIPKVRSSGLETARIYEGLAYSRLKQKRIDEAVSAIRLARSAAPDLALPAITSIKIDCARDASREQVRADLQALRARLDAKVTRIGNILRRGPFPAMERASRYAQIERRMVEQDPELYELCSYADLTPQI